MRKQAMQFSEGEKRRALNLAAWIEYYVPDDSEGVKYYAETWVAGTEANIGRDHDLAVSDKRDVPDGTPQFDTAMKFGMNAARKLDEWILEEAQNAEELWDVVAKVISEDIRIPNMPQSRLATVMGFQLGLLIAVWDVIGVPEPDACHPLFVGPIVDSDWNAWHSQVVPGKSAA